MSLIVSGCFCVARCPTCPVFPVAGRAGLFPTSLGYLREGSVVNRATGDTSLESDAGPSRYPLTPGARLGDFLLDSENGLRESLR